MQQVVSELENWHNRETCRSGFRHNQECTYLLTTAACLVQQVWTAALSTINSAYFRHIGALQRLFLGNCSYTLRFHGEITFVKTRMQREMCWSWMNGSVRTNERVEWWDLGTQLRHLLASRRVQLERSPVYSVFFRVLSHSPQGVLFDSVDWQWAYKVLEYCTSSLYALIGSSPNYIQYMYDALCSYLNILHVWWRQRRNKTRTIVSLQGFTVIVVQLIVIFLGFYLMSYMWFLWNIRSNQLHYTV